MKVIDQRATMVAAQLAYGVFVAEQRRAAKKQILGVDAGGTRRDAVDVRGAATEVGHEDLVRDLQLSGGPRARARTATTAPLDGRNGFRRHSCGRPSGPHAAR